MNIVQIGANEAGDACSDFVLNNKHAINCVHLVEPFSVHNEKLKQVYADVANVFIHNVAISLNPTDTELELYYPEQQLGSAHASASIAHLYAHAHSSIASIKVPCYTLSGFLDFCKLEVCDRIYIDTEGLDCKILLDFDPLKYKVQYIEYEITHTDGAFIKGETYTKCADKFKSLGYSLSPTGAYNECAVKIEISK
jgi:FkbM family methyltransferase